MFNGFRQATKYYARIGIATSTRLAQHTYPSYPQAWITLSMHRRMAFLELCWTRAGGFLCLYLSCPQPVSLNCVGRYVFAYSPLDPCFSFYSRSSIHYNYIGSSPGVRVQKGISLSIMLIAWNNQTPFMHRVAFSRGEADSTLSR